MLYLNAAGLSPFHPDVQQTIADTLESFSHVLYSETGIDRYRSILQRSRETLANWLELDTADRLAFVPNTTTACRLTLSRITWKPGDTLLTTTHENSTILQELQILKNYGAHVVSLDPDSSAGLLSAFEHALHQHSVRAIVVSHVSHLDGRIFPVEAIQQLAEAHHSLLFVDGAQAAGHIPLSFRHFHPHAYFFPGHKWCSGPMGTGALILHQDGENLLPGSTLTKNHNASLPPHGRHCELGTQNVGLIAGLAKACSLKRQDGLRCQALKDIRDTWQSSIRKNARLRTIDTEEAQAPGILAFVCGDDPTAAAIRTTGSAHSLAWKTFTHPSFPTCLSVRLSWNPYSSLSDLQTALSLFDTSLNT